MKNILIILICCLVLFSGCTKNSVENNLNNNKENNSTIKFNDTEENDTKMSNIKVIINDKTYTLNLENNKTVEEFVNILPQEFNMSELNGNEKYVYMDNSLTTTMYNPKHIEKGDVMIFGDNCLVIFYKSFSTSYSYTKIGHIDNLDHLESGNIVVRFEK